MLIQLVKPQWLKIPLETRRELIKIFEIPRTEATMIMGGTNSIVLSDGHSHKDLEAITVEKMQKYLDSELTDFFQLFDMVLDKINKTKTNTVEEESKKVETENIAKWLGIINNIRIQAKELGLEEQLNNLLYVEPIKKEKATPTNKGTKSGK
jgi:hypothetical protein